MNFTKHDGFLLCCSVIIYKGSRDTYYVRIKNPDFYHETPIRSKEHNKLVLLVCQNNLFSLNGKRYLEDDIPYAETSLQIDYIGLCVLMHSLILDNYVMTKYLDDTAFEDCMTVYRQLINPPNLEDND